MFVCVCIVYEHCIIHRSCALRTLSSTQTKYGFGHSTDPAAVAVLSIVFVVGVLGVLRAASRI